MLKPECRVCQEQDEPESMINGACFGCASRAVEDMPRLLAELKAERERCAELRRLVEVYGGLLLRR